MWCLVRSSCNKCNIAIFFNLVKKNSLWSISSISDLHENHSRDSHSIPCKSEGTNIVSDRSYFGFEKVSTEEKGRMVQSVFSSVASKYDMMNDIMSGGIHRLWKDYLIHILDPLPNTKLLDVACGTGDISFRFLKAVANMRQTTSDRILSPMDEIVEGKESCVNVDACEKVVMLDINQEMLTICKNRAKALGFHKGYTCLQGDAEKLPFPNSSFDAYTIAYGIRNVVNIEQALNEAYRVLKPGGRFLCLEFSHVINPVLAKFYDLYSFQVIPVMGQLIAGDWNSYQYLVESIRKFPNQDKFCAMVEESGFSMVSVENLLNGVAAIHSGYKI